MDALTADQIRASFVNCSKGESKRLPLPRQLQEIVWERLDFLGWRDPGAPAAAYVVAPAGVADREQPTGLVLRLGADRGARGVRMGGRQNLCSLCRTVHSTSDVALMVAPRAGASGRAGNTVGTYLCADLDCSLYARHLKRPERVQPPETLTVEQRVARLTEELGHFVRRVLTTR